MLAMFIAAHGALGWAYFYTFFKGPEPDHDAAVERIPRGWEELDVAENGRGRVPSGYQGRWFDLDERQGVSPRRDFCPAHAADRTARAAGGSGFRARRNDGPAGARRAKDCARAGARGAGPAVVHWRDSFGGAAYTPSAEAGGCGCAPEHPRSRPDGSRNRNRSRANPSACG